MDYVIAMQQKASASKAVAFLTDGFLINETVSLLNEIGVKWVVCNPSTKAAVLSKSKFFNFKDPDSK